MFYWMRWHFINFSSNFFFQTYTNNSLHLNFITSNCWHEWLLQKNSLHTVCSHLTFSTCSWTLFLILFFITFDIFGKNMYKILSFFSLSIMSQVITFFCKKNIYFLYSLLFFSCFLFRSLRQKLKMWKKKNWIKAVTQ